MTVSLETLILKGTSISENELKSLMKMPTARGEMVETLLANRQYTTSEDAVADLCRGIGVDFMKDIAFNDIPVDLVRNIPINYAKANEVLPFKVEAQKATILITNPLNQKVLGDMRVLFEKKVHPIVVTSAKMQEAINRVYEKKHGRA
jgi:general secretion pathway protein E